MIYSKDIDKICGVCQYARLNEERDNCYCRIYMKSLPQSMMACKKFSYDILKKPVRRRKKLDTNFSAEEFKL